MLTSTGLGDDPRLAAQAAFQASSAHDRLWRSGLLEALADALDAHSAELVAVADRETGLGTGRLEGEVGRSSFQFRLFFLWRLASGCSPASRRMQGAPRALAVCMQKPLLSREFDAFRSA